MTAISRLSAIAHKVLVRTMSKRVENSKETIRIDDGRIERVCSRWDNGTDRRVVAATRAPVARVSRVFGVDDFAQNPRSSNWFTASTAVTNYDITVSIKFSTKVY